LQSNDAADHEKAIIYNELMANAVVLQNVVDQTQALHAPEPAPRLRALPA
jgi:hypothetical protein